MKWKSLTISNPGLGLDRLSGETSNEQFVRELVVNSKQAIERSGVGDTITIMPAPGYDTPKFMCVDNGPGMTGSELDEKLNLFANDTHQEGNHGIGGKITTITRNPQGVIYLCRTPQGETTRATLKLDTVGKPVYAVETYATGDLPEQMRDHGTAVILLGSSAKQNTMLPPEGFMWQEKSRWIMKYLNSKFYRLPDSLRLRVWSGLSGDGNQVYITIRAQASALVNYALRHGVLELAEYNIHWYILPSVGTGNGKNTPEYNRYRPYNNVSAHTAFLFEDELYNLDSGPAALRKFGIHTGLAILYIEPRKAETYRANNARSRLLRRKGRGSVDVNVDVIAEEFRNNLPAEIEEWQNELIDRSGGLSTKQLLERLYAVHGYNLIPSAKNAEMMPATSMLDGMPPAFPVTGIASDSTSNSGSTPSEPRVAGENSRDRTGNGTPKPMHRRRGFPEIKQLWVSGEGMEPGMFAAFENGGRFELTMNDDWSGIEALIRLLLREGEGFTVQAVKARRTAARKTVKDHLAFLLCDVIYSAYEQLQKKHIDQKQFESMLSPAALTASAGARWHVRETASKELKKTGVLC